MQATTPASRPDARGTANAPGARDRQPAGRDFGTGYGRSSGYAAPRGYARDSGLPRFGIR